MSRIRAGSRAPRTRLSWLLPLVVVAGLPDDLLLAQGPMGPLGTSEQNPLYRHFYVLEVESADLIGEGTLRVEFSTSYSSIFEASNGTRHAHLFDLEQMTNSLAVRYGLSSSLEVAGRVGIYTGWEGFLDPVISGFHDLFGLPTGGRELQPEGQYLLLLEHDDLDGGEVDLDSDSRTLSLEEMRLLVKWGFLGDVTSPLAVSLSAGLRRAGGPLDAGRLDGALSLRVRMSRGSLHFHGSSGLVIMNAPAQLAPIAARRALHFSGAFEYAPWSSVSLVAQMSGSTSYLKRINGGELDGVPLNLTLGITGMAGGGWAWQASFTEDLIPSGPAIDFTLDLGLSRAFRDREGD